MQHCHMEDALRHVIHNTCLLLASHRSYTIEIRPLLKTHVLPNLVLPKFPTPPLGIHIPWLSVSCPKLNNGERTCPIGPLHEPSFRSKRLASLPRRHNHVV